MSAYHHDEQGAHSFLWVFVSLRPTWKTSRCYWCAFAAIRFSSQLPSFSQNTWLNNVGTFLATGFWCLVLFGFHKLCYIEFRFSLALWMRYPVRGLGHFGWDAQCEAWDILAVTPSAGPGTLWLRPTVGLSQHLLDLMRSFPPFLVLRSWFTSFGDF